MSCLHLPLDFEMREPVRRLALYFERVQNLNARDSVDASTLMVVRLWIDWGRAGSEWRPLDLPFEGEQHRWHEEPLSHLIEAICRWTVAGTLVPVLAKAGVVVMQQKGDLWGLSLSSDFWRENLHLDPAYMPPQRKGGFAKAANAEVKRLEDAAVQQTKILQGVLPLPEGMVRDQALEEKAVALVMRIYRACQLPIPNTSDYSLAVLQVATSILERYKNDQITQVERYLYKHKDDPAVVRIPQRILTDFDVYYRSAE